MLPGQIADPISLVPIKIIRHSAREKSEAISACSLGSPRITYSNFSIVTAPERNGRFIEVSKSLWFPENAMAADFANGNNLYTLFGSLRNA